MATWLLFARTHIDVNQEQDIFIHFAYKKTIALSIIIVILHRQKVNRLF